MLPSAFESGDPTREALNWTDLRRHLERRGLLDRDDLFIVSTHWLEGGKIDYALGGRLPVLVLTGNPKHFAFHHNQTEMIGKDAILVGRRKSMKEIDARYGDYFEALEPLEPVMVTRSGRPEIELVLYYGRRFVAPYPLPFSASAGQR